MAYALHIERQNGEITLDEWASAVAQVDGVRLTNQDTVGNNPATGEEVRISSNAGDAEVLIESGGFLGLGRKQEWGRAFRFSHGRATFRATESIESPKDSVHRAAAKLASLLGASSLAMRARHMIGDSANKARQPTPDEGLMINLNTSVRRGCAGRSHTKLEKAMARPGGPRDHDPLADKIQKAIWRGDIDKFKELVTEETVSVTDGDARTPLINAIVSKNRDMIKWVLECGADVNHQDRNGWSPLHAAVQEKQIEIVERLLHMGANPNLHDRFGNGPLWRAAMDSRGNFEYVDKLIAAGAHADHKNGANKSPIDIAKSLQDDALLARLKKG